MRGAAWAAVLAAALLSESPEQADEADPSSSRAAEPVITLSGEYILDTVAVARGADTGMRYVGLAALTAEVDLDAAAGWHGATLVAQGIAGTGQRPNDLAGTMQGINNSARPSRTRRWWNRRRQPRAASHGNRATCARWSLPSASTARPAVWARNPSAISGRPDAAGLRSAATVRWIC